MKSLLKTRWIKRISPLVAFCFLTVQLALWFPAPVQASAADDLKKILPLFSVCELLYSHVRNHAVHEMEFPLVSKVLVEGSIEYRDNHFITGTLLYDTVSNIVETLERECTDCIHYPSELPQEEKWQ